MNSNTRPWLDPFHRAVWLIGAHSFKGHHGQEIPDLGEEKARKMGDRKNFPASPFLVTVPW